VEICEEKEIYLIMDDIYRELVFAGNLSPNAFGFTTKEIDNSYIITINGVSKQFSMTGFRIGWAVGNKEVISAMNRIQGHQTSCPSAISQVATIGAIESGENEANNLKFNLEKKKNVLVQLLSEIPNIHFVKPQGTFYCFVDFSYYEKSSHKLAEYFIDKVEVITVPGKDFGMEGFLRISYCGKESELHEGLARIKTALQNY
jgi:aspartate/methionine/tyrosine aminotransferase